MQRAQNVNDVKFINTDAFLATDNPLFRNALQFKVLLSLPLAGHKINIPQI